MTNLISEESIALQEKQEKAQKAYMLIPIEDVRENNWNPNKLENVDFQKLKESIDKDGGNGKGPILVRTHPTEKGKYEIVDGAHRYKAMKDLGFEEIVAVFEELSDTEARLRTIGFNKFRGTFDNVLLAQLVHDLKETFAMTDEEINNALGYSEEEIKSLESLVDFDFSKYDDDMKIEDEKVEKDLIPEVFTLHLDNQSLTTLLGIISSMKIKDKNMAVMVMAKRMQESLSAGTCTQAVLDRLLSEQEGKVENLLPMGNSDEQKADSLIPEGVSDLF